MAKENISQLLVQWQEGSQDAFVQLVPLVYDEMRRQARGFLHREAQNHSMQPTELVHEVCLQLVDVQHLHWENRAQFFGLVATLMRHILVDRARRKRAAKRGGGEYLLSLSHAAGQPRQAPVDLLALDDAMRKLTEINPRYCRVVVLRYFGGLTIDETAAVLGVSGDTIKRDWNIARAWLRRELGS